MGRIPGTVYALALVVASACGANGTEQGGAARCGDQTCSDTESVMTCPADCPAVCGDNGCTHAETAITCPTDCPAVCGDGACTKGESPATCPADCSPICGDTLCSFGETAASCPVDCPAGCGDGACTHMETAETCASDCPSLCGDGFCSTDDKCSSCSEDCGGCLPASVDITLIGALIRPAMFDGRTWDGPDLTSAQVDELANVLATLAKSPQYGDIAGLIGNLAISAWAPPDPFGFGELAWNGPFDPSLVLPLGTTSTNVEDTFTPQWPGPPFPRWVNVPTSGSLRVRVTLEDEDLVNDDVIGTVDLDEGALRAAYNAGGTVGVLTYQQGVGHILYIVLSVTDSSPPVCNGECTSGTYSACTCAASDPCGWMGDGTCDSFCTANFPTDHFGDLADCAAACAADCSSLTYSACSCSSVDPCHWQGDGTCDATCALNFPNDHFHDPASDCP